LPLRKCWRSSRRQYKRIIRSLVASSSRRQFGHPELKRSECCNSAFAISNTYRSLYFVKEDLAVSDFSGCSSLCNNIGHLIYETIVQNYFQFNLWQKIHIVFSSAIGLRVALLPSMASHLRNRHSLDAELEESLFDRFESGWLYDRFNLRHLIPLSLTSWVQSPSSASVQAWMRM